MKVKDLEYLPARRVDFKNADVAEDVDVSLYGHWVHVKFKDDGSVESYPASEVAGITWR